MDVINDELNKLHEYDIPPEVIDSIRERITEHMRERKHHFFGRIFDKLRRLFFHDK
jgi:hypothetical protein